MKAIKKKDLVVGRTYWICRKGCKYSQFARPLIYVGNMNPNNRPLFTFGDTVESWHHEFNFQPSTSEYNFYEGGIEK